MVSRRETTDLCCYLQQGQRRAKRDGSGCTLWLDATGNHRNGGTYLRWQNVDQRCAHGWHWPDDRGEPIKREDHYYLCAHSRMARTTEEVVLTQPPLSVILHAGNMAREPKDTPFY